MSFSRKNIIQLLSEHGLEATEISVLKWSVFHYEFGRARLVAKLKPTGYAYSIYGVWKIGQELREGKTFFVEHTSGNDYKFGTILK